MAEMPRNALAPAPPRDIYRDAFRSLPPVAAEPVDPYVAAFRSLPALPTRDGPSLTMPGADVVQGEAPILPQFRSQAARAPLVTPAENAATMRQAENIANFAGGIRAFHGSPHSFDRFDMSKLGTGEGAQAYGHGLYFAENEGVARGYRDRLAPPPPTSQTVSLEGRSFADLFPADIPARGPAAAQVIAANGNIDQAIAALRARGSGLSARSADLLERYRGRVADIATPAPAGHMYEVDLNTTRNRLLDWDAPLAQQPAGDAVRRVLESVSPRGVYPGDVERGAAAYNMIGERHPLRPRDGTRGDPFAANALREAGIDGIQYLDAGSRAVAGGEILGATQGPRGWQAKVRTDGRGGAGFSAPAQQITTSRPFATEAEALAWAQEQVGAGSRNLVMFDDRLIEIMRRYGIGGIGAGLGATAVAQE